jgi:hypothetical protein
MAAFRLFLLIFNAALFAWIGYYFLKGPGHGDLLGHAVLSF